MIKNNKINSNGKNSMPFENIKNVMGKAQQIFISMPKLITCDL